MLRRFSAALLQAKLQTQRELVVQPHPMTEHKIVVMGTGAVGKTALVVRFVAGQFVEKSDPTIEDYYRTDIDLDNVTHAVEILDTADADAFVSMRDLYIKNGQGFVLVYSITDQYSFTSVQQLRDQILRVKTPAKPKGASLSVPILLVGNKCDLESERKVTARDGEMLAQEWGMPFFETSAKTEQNVTVMFHEAVREVLRYKSKAKRNKSGCCTLL